MTGAVFGDEALDFYRGLEADNTKAYWTAHKDTYERVIRDPLRALLDELAPVFEAEPTVFRPFRDVRFSADKSPYKTHQGGVLHVTHGVGYWIQLDAEGVQLGGGFHAHDKDETNRYRAAVDNPGTGHALATILKKLTGFQVGGEQVATRPRGVPADHPRLDLMRKRYLSVSRPVPVEDCSVALVRREWTKLRPLVEWIDTNVFAA